MALVLTDSQIAVLAASDTPIDQAFTSGVVSGSGIVAVPALTGYASLPALLKPITREPFKITLAVIMARLNIQGALPDGVSATIPVAKLTNSGTPGSLTFTNGFLTAFVSPT